MKKVRGEGGGDTYTTHCYNSFSPHNMPKCSNSWRKTKWGIRFFSILNCKSVFATSWWEIHFPPPYSVQPYLTHAAFAFFVPPMSCYGSSTIALLFHSNKWPLAAFCLGDSKTACFLLKLSAELFPLHCVSPCNCSPSICHQLFKVRLDLGGTAQ